MTHAGTVRQNPGYRQFIVECSCGFSAPALNRVDAERVKEKHLRLEEAKGNNNGKVFR